MVDWSQAFEKASDYDAFLDKYATPDQARMWQGSLDRVQLKDDQVALLNSFKRELKVILFAGAWCGDCIEQCPIVQRFALQAPSIQLRLLDRDQDENFREGFLLCGAPRVPQAVILSEDDQFISRTADKTLTKYRLMGSRLEGSSCSTGIVGIGPDPTFEGVVQDWLDEFEKAHWIVRLSPRLRSKHGD